MKALSGPAGQQPGPRSGRAGPLLARPDRRSVFPFQPSSRTV